VAAGFFRNLRKKMRSRWGPGDGTIQIQYRFRAADARSAWPPSQKQMGPALKGCLASPSPHFATFFDRQI
jgi:hypothetical protein